MSVHYCFRFFLNTECVVVKSEISVTNVVLVFMERFGLRDTISGCRDSLKWSRDMFDDLLDRAVREEILLIRKHLESVFGMREPVEKNLKDYWTYGLDLKALKEIMDLAEGKEWDSLIIERYIMWKD